MAFKTLSVAATLLTSIFPVIVFAQDAQLDMKSAGALEFSDTGTLFVGDNYNGAIYAQAFTDGNATSTS